MGDLISQSHLKEAQGTGRKRESVVASNVEPPARLGSLRNQLMPIIKLEVAAEYESPKKRTRWWLRLALKLFS